MSDEREGDTLSLSFMAKLDLVEGILPLVDEWAAKQGIFKDDRVSLRLVLEELLLNLCLYARSDAVDEDAEDAETRVDLTVTPIRVHNGGADASSEPTGGLCPPQSPESAPGKSPFTSLHEVHRLAITLRDTGRAFNPLQYEAQKSETIREAWPGGRGLALVRLLAAELQYARRYGSNILKLTLTCAGSGQGQPAPVGDAGVPAPGRARSGGILRAFARLWHSSLVVRQTVFFFCIFAAMLWSGLFFYYQAASDSRRTNAEKLFRQALHIQNVSSVTFLERLCGYFSEFLEEFRDIPEFPAAVADDTAFFEELRDGVILRTITAETAVLGVLKGKKGTPGAMLLYRMNGTTERLYLPLDFDPFVERSSRGDRSVWVGPIHNLPVETSQGHAGMLLAKTMNSEGDWIGLVITMPWIRETLDMLSGFESAASAFVTDKGEYVVYPPGRNVHGGPQGLADEAGANDSPEMKRFLESVRNREAGSIPLESLFPGDASPWSLPWPFPWKGATTLAYAPMTTEGWSLLLFVSSEEAGATKPPLPSGMVLLALFAPFVASLAAWKISSGVVRPLGRLSKSLNRIADGDLETPLPAPERHDEINAILRAFEHVRITLKHSFANLVEATAAEQRMKNELALARTIQESMLSASPPVVPGIKAATSIDMAGEVCGDLFDCFTLPDEPHNLYCLIGDVCGKGIPASVIMSRAMVLAKSFLLSGAGCVETLSRLNEALLRSNDSLMFVTLLVAKLDGTTGLFTWASAGHPPPMPGPAPFTNKPQPFAPLPWSRELVLGVKEDCSYTENSLHLIRGQSMLLYTDGADEAMTPESPGSVSGQSEGREIFGEERLRAVFTDACAYDKNTDAPRPSDVLRRVRASLLSHMGGAAPFDDVSLIVVRWDGV